MEALHDDSQIEQHFYEIDPKQRLDAVVRLLQHFRPQSCVAFCHTRQQCMEVVEHRGLTPPARPFVVAPLFWLLPLR